MTTTLAALREKLSRRIGDYREGSASGNGAADGTTVVDSSLASWPTDYFNNYWVKVTSGTYSGQARKCSSFTSSTGTLTCAAFGGQILSAVTYEIHSSDPDDKDTMLKEALRQLYPDLHKPVIDESLISGNWLRDGSIEEWSTSATPTYFTENSNMTPAQESTTKRFGSYSMKLTSGAANAYRGQSEGDNPWLLDLGGFTVSVRGWCKTSTASHARLHIYTVDDDGTAQNLYSSYHTGSNRWELLELENQALNDNLRSISIRFHGDVSAGVVYWDYVRLLGPNQDRYYLPPTITRLSQIWFQLSGNPEGEEDMCDDLSEMSAMAEVPKWHIEDDGTDKVIVIPYTRFSGHKIRLIGTTYLTQPASDSATTEINEPQSDLVVAHTAYMINSMSLGRLPAGDVSRQAKLAEFWPGEYKRLKRDHAMIAPPRTFTGGM